MAGPLPSVPGRGGRAWALAASAPAVCYAVLRPVAKGLCGWRVTDLAMGGYLD